MQLFRSLLCFGVVILNACAVTSTSSDALSLSRGAQRDLCTPLSAYESGLKGLPLSLCTDVHAAASLEKHHDAGRDVRAWQANAERLLPIDASLQERMIFMQQQIAEKQSYLMLDGIAEDNRVEMHTSGQLLVWERPVPQADQALADLRP